MNSQSIKNNRTSIKVSTLVVLALMLSLIVGTMNNMFSAISNVGLMALLGILLSANFILIWHLLSSKEIHKTHLIVSSLALVFIAINSISLLANLNSRSIITLFQFASLIGFFMAASLMNWSKLKIKIVRTLSLAFILFHFLYWIAQGLPQPFSSIYPNPNLIGTFIFLMLFFIFMNKRSKKINAVLTVLSLIIIYSSGSRSIFICVIASVLVYLIWPVIIKSKKIFLGFLVAVFSGIFTFIFIYPNLIYWDKFHVFNNFVFANTGKNIYTGREVIWVDLISKINENPIFGHGIGMLPSDVLQSGLSAHNLYLQMALQSGYSGLIVFILILTTIWMAFWKNKNHRIVRLTASFFIAILIYQTFEVSLTQNQISTGIIQWFIFSIGLSFAINKHKSDEVL